MAAVAFVAMCRSLHPLRLSVKQQIEAILGRKFILGDRQRNRAKRCEELTGSDGGARWEREELPRRDASKQRQVVPAQLCLTGGPAI